jgi:peptidoglycan/xylan/chitin deacetylase (PgdA/CDA1 family)
MQLAAMALPAAMSVILLYHRVATLLSDPWGLAISRERFAQHLDVLNTHARVVGLSEMLRLNAQGRLPKDAVSITFDDGYADNVLHASPILRTRGVPATFFIVSGNVDQPREFWWDELERLLLQPGELPATLDVTIAGRSLHWDLSTARHLSADDAVRWRRWRTPDEPASARHALYKVIWQELLGATASARDRVMDSLREWSGVADEARALHRPVSTAQVADLAASPLFEVGAHTVTHPRLPALQADDQRQELAESRRRLQDLAGRDVYHCAYPFGMYSSETAELAQQCGYASAVTVEAGPLQQESRPFALPRIVVGDWDGETLLRELSPWLPMTTALGPTELSRRTQRHATPNSHSSLRLPRVFHRVWLGDQPMPEEFVRFGESWMAKHPGWTMRLWTDANVPSLINQAEFDAGRNAAQKGDVLKYELVYRFGGVYVDTDMECLRNIEPLLRDVDAFAAWESQECVNVAIFGAVRGHGALREVIDRLPASFAAEQPGRQDLSTGPGLFTEVVHGHTDVVLYGPELFYPYHFSERHRQAEVFPAAYAVHHWAYSWAPAHAST